MNMHYVHMEERVAIEVSHSEVCIHMQVAGKIMLADLHPTGCGWATAQLYTLDGQPFSAPITPGEAGFYWDSDRRQFYCYPANPETADFGKRVRVTIRIGRHEEIREGCIYRTLIGGNGQPVYEVDFGDGPQRLRQQDQVEVLQ